MEGVENGLGRGRGKRDKERVEVEDDRILKEQEQGSNLVGRKGN